MRYFSGTSPKGNTHFKTLDRLTIRVATAVGSVVLAFASRVPEALADRYRYPLGDISHAELLERHEVFRRNYTEYVTPEPIEGLPADLAVQILFGTWCHDSEREVPRMLKLLKASGVKQENISLIALDIRKEEPEGRAKALDVRFTPTFIFLTGGTEMGRIVERPNVNLEHDIKAMLGK
jgi:thiol-disulfide isomerase/thioredoxin